MIEDFNVHWKLLNVITFVKSDNINILITIENIKYIWHHLMGPRLMLLIG